jgi:uncharacterized protein
MGFQKGKMALTLRSFWAIGKSKRWKSWCRFSGFDRKADKIALRKEGSEGDNVKKINEASLSEEDLGAINAAVKVLKERLNAEKIILYGSKARGDAHEDSDIDLLIISPEPVHWRERKAIMGELFNIGMEHGCMISVLIVTAEEWAGGMFSFYPIYGEIMKDGMLAA